MAARRMTLKDRSASGVRRPALALYAALMVAYTAYGQAARITLDQAIEMALRHNHILLANRTNIQQNEAQEITANLRPNPTLFADWEYLPLYRTPSGTNFFDYLHDSTEGDIGMSYLFERGQKRQHRLEAAKDATAVTRSQVADNERTLSFQVAQLFINVQLAESTLELAHQDLDSFQKTVELAERQQKSGAISENDYLKIRLQLLQFQTDVQQAELAKVQTLSDLRQLLGYESISRDYDVTGAFDYQGLAVRLDDLQARALDNRPDLRAAHQGVTAANSQYELAKANGKQDVTVSGNYSHVNTISAFTVAVNMPLPVFNRNQGEIARTRYGITQAEEQRMAAAGQVLTDVRDAYEGFQTNDRVVHLYRSGYLEIAQKSRDISEYAYRRGGVSLIDFLDTERSYRATQLAYRQALASYLVSVEQLRQAVGSRTLP